MSNNKYIKQELFAMDAVEVYKMVINKNTLKKFPNGFWQRPDAEENAIKCIKYMIESILKWTDEDIKQNLCRNTFYKNALKSALEVMGGSVYGALNKVYPNKFKPWELKRTPASYWNVQHGIIATKWLIEEKLKWSDEEIVSNLSANTFAEHGLRGMLHRVFNDSPYKALNSTFPNRFKPWQLQMSPMGLWDLDNGIAATKWLIEERLQWSREDIEQSFSRKIFYDNGLGGMLYTVFNGSPYKAISYVYPNQFKEWELNNVPIGFWTLSNGIKATKWLIEEKLKLSDEELNQQLSKKMFIDNGLSGMLQYCFKDSPMRAISLAYPDKYNSKDK